MLICGLDFESSGLKIETIGVTEVGIIIWDTVTRSPIRSFSTIVDPGPDVIWEPGALEVNNLTPEICRDLGMPDEEAARRSLRWYGSSDVACAHNGNKFDRPLLEKWAKKYNLDWQPSKVWIDTKTDLELPIGKDVYKRQLPGQQQFNVNTEFAATKHIRVVVPVQFTTYYDGIVSPTHSATVGQYGGGVKLVW